MTETLKINTEKPVQENFLGANAVYHGFAFREDDCNRVYNKEQIEMELDRAQQVGLRIARTYFRWEYVYDPKTKTWDWDSKDMQALYKWADECEKRGIDIALGACWWCSGDLYSGESPFFVSDDYMQCVPPYAKFVSELVHQLREVRDHKNIKYLIMFTEPQRCDGPLPKGMSVYEPWYYAVKAAHEQLVKDNRRHLVKLVGPNEGSTATAPMLKWLMDRDMDFIDIFSAHNYLPKIDLTKDDVHSGKFMYIQGGPLHCRGQQPVMLKKNTEYEMKIWVKIKANFKKHISGYVMFGALDREEGSPYFKCQEPASRINDYSTRIVGIGELADEWREFTHRFNTFDHDELVYIGFFNNVFAEEGGAALFDDVSLKEVGSDVEILKNPGFEECSTAWETFGTGEFAYDTYNTWSHWVEIYLSHLKTEEQKKHFWYDEYNYAGNYEALISGEKGTEIAMAQTAFMNHGLESSLMWTLFDQQWPNWHNEGDSFTDGLQRCGIMPVLTESKVPYKAYYAFSLINNKMGNGEGTKVYKGTTEGCEPELHLTATEDINGEISVMVVNKRKSEAEFTVDLGAFKGKKFNRYLYDSSKIIPTEECKDIESDKVLNGEISDKLPALSFAIYTTK